MYIIYIYIYIYIYIHTYIHTYIYNHGSITRTGITCKKIPCYMHDSACSWLIIEDAKMFNIFEFSHGKKMQNLDRFMQISFHESANHVS